MPGAETFCHEPEYLHFTITIFDLNYGLIQLFPFKLIIVICFALPSMHCGADTG